MAHGLLNKNITVEKKNIIKNKKNFNFGHVSNLCPEYHRSGSGICFNIACPCFHPKVECKYDIKCLRSKCSFLHSKDYYENIYCQTINNIYKLIYNYF